MTADRKRPWWLAWTNPRIAWFFAVLSAALLALYSVGWLPGKDWFLASVYVVLILLAAYSWWAVWYLARRRKAP